MKAIIPDSYWLFFARAAVVFIALLLSAWLIQAIPTHATKISVSLFGIADNQMPMWAVYATTALFSFFVMTVFFPFFLTVGWMKTVEKKGNYDGSLPFVSIIIPAFNEEKSILRTLEALRQLDYPMFEVIIVNDGSTDYTFSVIERAHVKCIHLKRNQGKAAALNVGIAEAKGSIVVFSDSDSWLHPMALRHLVQGFHSPEVAAVSGTIEVAHATNLLGKWQVIEYSFGQFFIKVAQLGSGSSVAICPGPVNAFRKELLLKTGGFKNRTITEDFDATLEAIKAGFKVNYAPKAIAYTEAPSTLSELKRQRLRWFRGHVQTFLLHRDLFFSPTHGMLGFYWLPVYYLFLGYFCGLIELLLLPILILSYIVTDNGIVMLQLTIIYAAFATLCMSTGYAFVLQHTRRFSPALMAAAIVIYPYIYCLNILRIWAVYNEVRGKVATWSG